MSGPAIGATHTVRVLPDEIELVVEDGETVMDAAERLGWRWPTLCHGACECTVCWLEIVEGEGNAAPMRPAEREVLEDFALARTGDKQIRLGCQTIVHGDLVVRKRGVTSA